jgi:hypothetical protein
MDPNMQSASGTRRGNALLLGFLLLLPVVFTACGGGSMSSGGNPPANDTSTLSWDITDSCSNGQQVYLRFFDTTDHVQWPPDTTQVYVLNYNNDQKFSLSCVTNAQICYGASVAGNNSGYWGVGENGDQSCSNCCYSCVTNTVQPISLTCP